MFCGRVSSLLIVYIAFSFPEVLAQYAGVANMAKGIVEGRPETVSKTEAKTQTAFW